MASTASLASLDRMEVFPASGRITHISAMALEADGPDCAVGDHCEVLSHDGAGPTVRVQVAAVGPASLRLVPFADVSGVRVADRVLALPRHAALPAGNAFAGRAVDGLARPIDGGGPIAAEPAAARAVPVLDRTTRRQRLVTGIRALDAFIPLGKGQRIGILAASGVGKTSLLEQLLRQVDCQKIVICLVGERGREVEALWRAMDERGSRGRVALVAATSDESAPMRAQAVEQALTLAEQWRDEGEDVLLVVDSITRLAMALREIGLIAGEPPTARGYTPNVFGTLPQIVERCGARAGGGSITAVFTVLSETDDVDDPIVEAMKSYLDGHIVLSRALAQAGHFPAIDVCRSVSRLFGLLTAPSDLDSILRCRALIAGYEEARTMVESGLYKSGSEPELDAAIAARSALNAFLQQRADECAPLETTLRATAAMARRPGP